MTRSELGKHARRWYTEHTQAYKAYIRTEAMVLATTIIVTHISRFWASQHCAISAPSYLFFLIEHWAGNKYWVHVHFAVKHRDNFAFVCVVCAVFIQSPHSSWANNSSWMMICIAVIRECMSRENLKYITSAGDDTISRDGSRQWGFCAHLGRVLCANKIARKGRRRCRPYFA